jgi:arsenical pump membrane protein
LLLVAGLFVLVRAVENAGLLHWTQAALGWVARLPEAAGVFLAGGVVAVANNLVNNLPLGLVVSATLQAAHTGKLLQHVLLVAVDVGPNLSVTGSLATILWLLALRRGGQQVSFQDFLKAGALAMPAALVAALAVLLVASKL